MLKCSIKTSSFFSTDIFKQKNRQVARHSQMNERDDFFYQAVVYAKEKDYKAARAMLRNLLFRYPDDIEGLLLYSIVAQNREGSIQALKRILRINPDHEIAFAKLAKLKYAPPASIPSPTAPLPIPSPVVKPIPVSLSKVSAEATQRKPLESRLKHARASATSTPMETRSTPPFIPETRPLQITPEEVIQRKTQESGVKRTTAASIPAPAAQQPTPPPAVQPVARAQAPEEVIQRKILEPSRRINPKDNSARKKSRKKRRIVDMVLIGLLILTCLLVSFVGMQELSRLFTAGS